VNGQKTQPPRIRNRLVALRAPAIALILLTLAASLQAQPPAGDVLAKYGIRAIHPASPATDFTLPDLKSGQVSLSDFHGTWVVLTFFATWCGPCRSELPSLERLHQDRALRGVTVLGVSVDNDRTPLDPFVRQLKLSFPILWDQQGRVGALYRASSIPVSYLIDPAGRVVGVSRGARDWSALTAMLDALLDAVPPTADTDARDIADAYASGDQPVVLGEVTDPPTAELALETQTPQAGKPFFLDIHLRWAGNFDEYLPQTPQIQLPEGVVRETVTASTSSRQGRNQLTYRVTLRAEEPGSYALDPVELRYTPRFDGQPMASRVQGPTVEVRAPEILGMRRLVLGIGAGVVVVVGLLVWGISRRLRDYRRAPELPQIRHYERLREMFEAARKKRLQGEGAAFMLALAEIDQELGKLPGAPPGDADPALDEAIERARYAGEVPPADELDQLQRRLERQIDALRPDPAVAERQSVRLRDENSRIPSNRNA